MEGNEQGVAYTVRNFTVHKDTDRQAIAMHHAGFVCGFWVLGEGSPNAARRERQEVGRASQRALS